MSDWGEITPSAVYSTIWVCSTCGFKKQIEESYDDLDSLHLCDECEMCLWLKDFKKIK